MKCHGYVHHVCLKNPISFLFRIAQQIYELYFEQKVAWYTTKKNYNLLNWKLGPYQFSEKFWLSFWTYNDWGVLACI